MKKAAFILALVMLLGVAAGCGESNGEASVQSVSMICGIGTAGLTDRFAGVVSAMGETNIKKDDSLTIGEIKVKVGDAVKVGDVLFTYDMSQLEISLEEAQIALDDLKDTLADKEKEKEQAEAALNEIADDAERNKTLGQIRQLNLDIRTTNRSITEKGREIEKIQNNMKNSSVKAEVEGEVKSVNPNGGTDDRGNALPLISIVQTGGFRVKGYVNESNASVLNEGAKVVIRARTGNQTWSGAITSIDWNNPAQSGGSNYYDGGSSDTGTSSKYPFYVELDSSDGLLLGQHVYIEPDLGQSDSPTGIQLPAGFINDADTSPWVWAQGSNGKLEKRSVTLGEYNGELDTYAVTDGLTASDYIAYSDDTLKAGMTCVTYDESTFEPDDSVTTPGGDMDGMDGMDSMPGGTDGMGDMSGMDGMTSGTDIPEDMQTADAPVEG